MIPSVLTRPSMLFIGVTTGQSAMMRIFPAWCETLGIDADLIGVDFVLQDDPARYREVVQRIKDDPLILGALVTTHKLDLFAAAEDLFDELVPLAALLKEVSCIYKHDGRLIGAAVDADTSGLALASFVPVDHWRAGQPEVLILGAGGAAVACAWYLRHPDRGISRPACIQVSDISAKRLEHFRRVHQSLHDGSPYETVLVEGGPSDALVEALPCGSLIINATGMGKDLPGSPLSDAVRFPCGSLIWELNYRGERLFLQQATNQVGLIVEDGWTYFLHGWMTVMSHVFAQTIPKDADSFDRLSKLARRSGIKI